MENEALTATQAPAPASFWTPAKILEIGDRINNYHELDDLEHDLEAWEPCAWRDLFLASLHNRHNRELTPLNSLVRFRLAEAAKLWDNGIGGQPQRARLIKVLCGDEEENKWLESAKSETQRIGRMRLVRLITDLAGTEKKECKASLLLAVVRVQEAAGQMLYPDWVRGRLTLRDKRKPDKLSVADLEGTIWPDNIEIEQETAEPQALTA